MSNIRGVLIERTFTQRLPFLSTSKNVNLVIVRPNKPIIIKKKYPQAILLSLWLNWISLIHSLAFLKCFHWRKECLALLYLNAFIVPSFIPTTNVFPALLAPTHLPFVLSAGSPVLKLFYNTLQKLTSYQGSVASF